MHQTVEGIFLGYEVQRNWPTRNWFEANDAANVKSFDFMENLKLFSSSSAYVKLCLIYERKICVVLWKYQKYICFENMLPWFTIGECIVNQSIVIFTGWVTFIKMASQVTTQGQENVECDLCESPVSHFADDVVSNSAIPVLLFIYVLNVKLDMML